MFSKMLIAVDDSSCAERAGRVGLEFAQKIGAKVLVTHVVKSAPGFMGLEPPPGATWRYLENLLTPWKQLGQQMKLNLHTQHLMADDVAEGIVFAAEQGECDLIVMGTHGREGLPRVFLGSVAERVSRLCALPLMLVRGNGPATPVVNFEHILAPVDGSEVGRAALALADELATRLGAQLQILHVVPPLPSPMANGWGSVAYNYGALAEESKKEGKAILEAARQQAKSPKVYVEMVEALFRHESDLIVEYASQHCDLVVMGTHGRSGVERMLLGSVAQGVTHHAAVPVLLMRAQTVLQSPQTTDVQATSTSRTTW